MRYTPVPDGVPGVTVEDDPDGGSMLRVEVEGNWGEGEFYDEAAFDTIVEAGVRRMVLRDEDHAAQMLGRAILWARAQKEPVSGPEACTECGWETMRLRLDDGRHECTKCGDVR